MSRARVHARVTGRVQGVFFRDCTAKEATRLGLSGWVRNRDDGSVETEFQGEEGEVALMVRWLHRGSPLSQVSDVATVPLAVVPAETGFMVRY